MSREFKGLHGIKIFAFDLMAIISSGAIETIDKIEEEIQNETVTNYIFNKYSDMVQMPYDSRCQYDIESWNKRLSDFSGWVEGNESRKFGIRNNDDGLLLLVDLIIELLEEPKN